MNLSNILKNEFIVCQHIEVNKKSLLEKLSAIFAQNQSDLKPILFEAFLKREALGSTAIGHGVAIPHIRTDLFEVPKLAIIQLKKSINFDAEDKRPVDLIFALIAPENDHSSHLNLLAECANLLSQEQARQKIRAAQTTQEMANTLKDMMVTLEKS